MALERAPFDTEISLGPKKVDSYWILADDGVRLRVACWASRDTSSGTVFLLQGRTENLEKYGPVAKELANSGFTVFGIDWRGQGMSDRLASDRMLGHVRKFSDYQRDLKAMIDAAETLALPKPWFLLGHSLGACVGMRYAIEHQDFAACGFTAPLWGINLPAFKYSAAWVIAWLSKLIGKGTSYAPGTKAESYVLNTQFELNRLTTDPQMYEHYVRISKKLPDQQIGGPSMGWLLEALRETRALSDLRSPQVPCVTFCGEEDSVVADTAAENRMANWPNGRFIRVPNARHDILYERPEVRETVLNGIIKLYRDASSRVVTTAAML